MEATTRSLGSELASPGDRDAAPVFEGALSDERPVTFSPTADELLIAAPDGRKRHPWATLVELHVGLVDAGPGAIAVVRLTFDDGTCIDMTPRDAPVVVHAPVSLGEEYGPLIRVERMRMLAATIITRAKLGEEGDGRFRRGAKDLPARPVDPHPRRLPRWAPPVLIVLSFVALIVFFNLSLGAAAAALIILFVHEYGHAIAMRLGDIPVRGVIFIPLVGAGTVPEHSFPTRWHEVGVALAGPLTALPVTAAIVFLLRQGILTDDVGREALIWALGVNLLNLLPVMPMDGGRVWNAVALELPRAWRGKVAYTPAVLAALLIPFATGVGIAVLLLFLGISVLSTTALLRRAASQEWIEEEGLDRDRLRAALREVNHALIGRARDDIDGGVPPTRLGAGRAILALVGYVAEIGLLIATYFVVSALLPGFLGSG